MQSRITPKVGPLLFVAMLSAVLAGCGGGGSGADAGSPAADTGVFPAADAGVFPAADAGGCTSGDSCGAGRWCSNGACVSCSATDQAHCGTASSPAGCAVCSGATAVCSAGACICTSDDSCGTGNYCSSGACVSCSATDSAHCGTASSPAGCAVCSGATPVCSAGACVCTSDDSCGAGHYCSSGACVPCSATEAASCGTEASPAGCAVCVGETPTCSAGVCVCASDASCGPGSFCSSGACASCSATDAQRCGTASSPAGCAACSGATPACASGVCVCEADASCGAGNYCSNGACAPCSADDAARCGTSSSAAGCAVCSGATPVCASGACVCAADASCGAGGYCSGGACAPCSADDAAHCGTSSSAAGCAACSNATPVCASGACVCDADASCGTGSYCAGSGTCEACSDTDPAHCGTATSPAGCAACPGARAGCFAGGCLSSSCYELLLARPGLPSGDYLIDPDGPGPLAPMTASCDMTTDGGGWTLVLDYLHQATTNPDRLERTASLPLLGSEALGDDESGTAHWGHAAPALIAALRPTEVRFFGKTTNHPRVIHFKTDRRAALTYLTTGTGTFDGIQSAFVPLAGHTAHLPGEANGFFADAGADTLASHPFYAGGSYHWNINPPAPYAGRWEVDDWLRTDTGAPANGYSASTLHQVWVRSAPTCEDGVQNGAETGVDCGGSGACARCKKGEGCNTEADCVAGATCTPGAGGSTCDCAVSCTGNCTDLATDFHNCGTCGRSCIPSQLCSGGACVNLASTDLLGKIKIVPTCIQSGTTANFEIVNENPFTLDIGYVSGEFFQGTINLETGVVFQLYVYANSMVDFYYSNVIFRTLPTNNQLCGTPQERFVLLYPVCSTATESVWDIESVDLRPVDVVIDAVSVVFPVTAPPKGSPLRFVTPVIDLVVQEGARTIVQAPPPLAACPVQ